MNVENAIEVLHNRGAKMTKDHEEGWIGWGGGERPVELHTLVFVRYRDNVVSASARPAAIYDWKHGVLFSDIIAYRVFEPEAKEESAA